MNFLQREQVPFLEVTIFRSNRHPLPLIPLSLPAPKVPNLIMYSLENDIKMQNKTFTESEVKAVSKCNAPPVQLHT